MYNKLKEEYQARMDKILEENRVFWAYNDNQFLEGVAEKGIPKGTKIGSLGMGGYYPYENKEKLMQDMERLDKWYKLEMKKLRENKKEQEEAIFYELQNHECFYTENIDDVCRVLPEIDRKEIARVYGKYAKAYIN